MPNPERSKCLAGKAQPFGAEVVIDLYQDEGLRRVAANHPIRHLLDQPDEIRRVIDLRSDFHPIKYTDGFACAGVIENIAMPVTTRL